jgi:hypothetical protein
MPYYSRVRRAQGSPATHLVVQGMSTNIVTDQFPRRLIDAKGAAQLYSVSWRTWLRWADAGLVPWGAKISGRRLWSVAELDDHIRGGCRPVRKGGRV